MLPKSSNRENHSFKKSKKKIAQSVGFAVCSLQFVFYHDCPHPFSVCKLLQTQREISSFLYCGINVK